MKVGYPAEMIEQCLRQAFDEIIDAHPEFDPLIDEFAVLMGEALTLSPQFSWAIGNIWYGVDVEVKN